MFAGYGADSDSYLVVNAAKSMAQTGRYAVSRFPGYPMYELMTALSTAFVPAKTGHLISNGLTAVFSCGAFLFFVLILKHFRISRYMYLALAFAITPIVYVNSTCTMDYVPAVALALGSTYFVLVRRPALAGASLGLAIGCRITYGAMLLPLGLWMLLEERTTATARRLLVFCTVAALVGGICFSPVIFRYGRSFLHFYDSPECRSVMGVAKEVLGNGVLGVWGNLGALGLLLVLASSLLSSLAALRASLTRPLVSRGLALSALTVGLYGIAFVRLPVEPAYLIPIVPFVLLSVGLVARPGAFKYIAAILLLSSFVYVGRHGVSMFGPIVDDHQRRESLMRRTEQTVEMVEHLPESSVVVSADNLPRIVEALGGKSYQGTHEYVYAIRDTGTFKRYVADGRTVFFLPGVDRNGLLFYRVDLRQLGAKQLDVPNWEVGHRSR
jgi:hypothetical protein